MSMTRRELELRVEELLASESRLCVRIEELEANERFLIHRVNAANQRVFELERLLREARGYLSAQPPPEFMSHVLSLLGRLDVVLGPPHA